MEAIHRTDERNGASGRCIGKDAVRKRQAGIQIVKNISEGAIRPPTPLLSHSMDKGKVERQYGVTSKKPNREYVGLDTTDA